MPGVVTSAGVTLGELPLTRQQHSIARSASGPSLVMMVKTGAAGSRQSSRGEEAGELPELSSTDRVGGCVPIPRSCSTGGRQRSQSDGAVSEVGGRLAGRLILVRAPRFSTSRQSEYWETHHPAPPIRGSGAPYRQKAKSLQSEHLVTTP